MTAAYRLKGIGWFVGLAAVALGFYLISLQVAAERKKLDDVTARIAQARRDLRALETEFDTRANLRQLERWNGDTLALSAPTAAQFVSDDATLSSLDPTAPMPAVLAATLVVPALGDPAPVQVALAAVPAAVSAPIGHTRRVAPQTETARHAAPSARPADVAHAGDAGERVRPQTVALLDRQLLSDTTFGAIASGARREARR